MLFVIIVFFFLSCILFPFTLGYVHILPGFSWKVVYLLLHQENAGLRVILLLLSRIIIWQRIIKNTESRYHTRCCIKSYCKT